MSANGRAVGRAESGHGRFPPRNPGRRPQLPAQSTAVAAPQLPNFAFGADGHEPQLAEPTRTSSATSSTQGAGLLRSVILFAAGINAQPEGGKVISSAPREQNYGVALCVSFCIAFAMANGSAESQQSRVAQLRCK